MGKPMPPPPTPPPLYEPLQQAFLFTGDFKWMFYFTLVVFCAANAKAILGANPKINYFHGCVLMVLANFGGSTIAAVMVGKPVAFVCNEALVTCCLLTWTVIYLMPSVVFGLMSNPVGRQLTSLCYEIQRCHVLMNCTKMAAACLPAQLAVPSPGRVAIIGPLIAGTLGGCGGGFMPLDKGLGPIEKGLNWRMASALINSTWMFLSTQYPASKEAIGLDGDMARFLAVSFFALFPTLEAVLGTSIFGANPTLPAAPQPAAKAKKS